MRTTTPSPAPRHYRYFLRPQTTFGLARKRPRAPLERPSWLSLRSIAAFANRDALASGPFVQTRSARLDEPSRFTWLRRGSSHRRARARHPRHRPRVPRHGGACRALRVARPRRLRARRKPLRQPLSALPFGLVDIRLRGRGRRADRRGDEGRERLLVAPASRGGLAGRPLEALAAVILLAFASLRPLIRLALRPALEARLLARAFALSAARLLRRECSGEDAPSSRR